MTLDEEIENVQNELDKIHSVLDYASSRDMHLGYLIYLEKKNAKENERPVDENLVSRYKGEIQQLHEDHKGLSKKIKDLVTRLSSLTVKKRKCLNCMVEAELDHKYQARIVFYSKEELE